MIPNILHVVWTGPNPLPAYAQRSIDRFQALHPQWAIRIWDDKSVLDLPLSRDIVQGLEPYSLASDIIRWEAVLHEGGFYMDLDGQILRGINYLRELDYVICQQPNKTWLSTHFFGLPKSHYFAMTMLQTVIKNVTEYQKEDISVEDIVTMTADRVITNLWPKNYPPTLLSMKVPNLDGSSAFLFYEPNDRVPVQVHWMTKGWGQQRFKRGVQ